MSSILHRHSIKNQLSHLFHKYSYLSTGLSIPPTITTHPTNNSYRINIANQIYQHYRTQQFKYCEQGITPQTIAYQMQVHIQQQQQEFVWDINQFGVFEVKIQLRGLRKIMQEVLQMGQFLYVGLNVWEREIADSSLSLAMRQKMCKWKDNHIFDYFIPIGLDQADIARMRILQSRAMIAQHLNNHTISRRIILQDLYNQPHLQQYQQISKILNISPSTIIQIQQINKNIQNNHQYHIACNRSQRIKYQNKFKYHTIHQIDIDRNMGNQHGMEGLLSMEVSNMERNVEKYGNFIERKNGENLGMFVVRFGDLVGEYRLWEAYCLVQQLKSGIQVSKYENSAVSRQIVAILQKLLYKILHLKIKENKYFDQGL